MVCKAKLVHPAAPKPAAACRSVLNPCRSAELWEVRRGTGSDPEQLKEGPIQRDSPRQGAHPSPGEKVVTSQHHLSQQLLPAGCDPAAPAIPGKDGEPRCQPPASLGKVWQVTCGMCHRVTPSNSQWVRRLCSLTGKGLT